MIYKSILKREMIVQGTTTFVIKIWALVFGVEFLFHLIGFTYIAWVGSICHVDTFVRCRVFSQKEQVDAQCVLQKTKLVDQRPVVAGNFFSGIRGGPSRFQGALRVCTVPTGWVPLCTDHCALLVCVHSGLCTELVADTQCCSSLQNQIQSIYRIFVDSHRTAVGRALASSPKTLFCYQLYFGSLMGSPLSHWGVPSQTQGDTSTALEGPQQGSSRDQGQDHHRIWDHFLGAKSFWTRSRSLHWRSSSFCDRWWLLKAPGNLWWC